jgi:hypothetical protein
MTKKFVVFAIGLALVTKAHADQGTTSASFLKLDTGPRAIAMGGSFAGLADDVNAIQYNPAGLAYVPDKEVTLMHAVWFEDIFYDYLALDWPMQSIGGTLGLNVLYLSAGTFDKYVLDANNNPVAQGTFTADSLEAGLTYSRCIIPSVSAGLTIKMISETIASASTSGVAVDLAGMWKLPIKGLAAGIDISNLGPSIGFQQTYGLPITTRVGVGYKPTDLISVDCDYTQPVETVGVFSLGGEYGYRDFLFIRLGYKYGGAVDYNQTFTGYGPAVASGLCMGLGFKLYKNYSADYSYSNYGFLGTPQRIAISAKFQ